eukprot:360817-Chlamydomonas_euryale.AAC.3
MQGVSACKGAAKEVNRMPDGRTRRSPAGVGMERQQWKSHVTPDLTASAKDLLGSECVFACACAC